MWITLKCVICRAKFETLECKKRQTCSLECGWTFAGIKRKGKKYNMSKERMEKIMQQKKLGTLIQQHRKTIFTAGEFLSINGNNYPYDEGIFI